MRYCVEFVDSKTGEHRLLAIDATRAQAVAASLDITCGNALIVPMSSYAKRPPPNPLPNEWAARQRSPSGYDRFRRIPFGQGISAILGFKGSTGSIQSIRFDKRRWSRSAAERWLFEHGHVTRIE